MFGYAVAVALARIHNIYNINRCSTHYASSQRYRPDRIEYIVFLHQILDSEDQLEININVFSCYEDECKKKYTVYLAKKILMCLPVANIITLFMSNVPKHRAKQI